MRTMGTAWEAGLSEWRHGPQPLEWRQQVNRYMERWLLYRGELFIDAWRNNPYKDDPRVYRGIQLLWNHTGRVVDFYSNVVYQGRLSHELGEGAIPIVPDPDMSKPDQLELMHAISQLWIKWNYQRSMVIRPKLTAALGDTLTILVDDPVKRWVYPKHIYPGYVVDLELDHVGNVEYYAIEYRVQEEDKQRGIMDNYLFRMEVDSEEYRYYKNGEPWRDMSEDGHGEAHQENPYGFTPAVWDRHITEDLSDRGYSATDQTRQALFGLNSLFSHSKDFNHKAFLAPIIVAGAISAEGQKSINLATPKIDQSAMAEHLGFIEGTRDTTIHQPSFDIGDTLAQIELMEKAILMQHPEAVFFDRLANAQNVTGPGADRIIIPVRGLTEHARAGYDSTLIHLIQMAISMIGMRVNEGDWGSGNLGKRREAFRGYNLVSYEQDKTAFTIGARDIILPGKSERIAQAREIESLQTRWAMIQAGVPETEIDGIINDRQEAQDAMVNRGAVNRDYLRERRSPLDRQSPPR